MTYLDSFIFPKVVTDAVRVSDYIVEETPGARADVAGEESTRSLIKYIFLYIYILYIYTSCLGSVDNSRNNQNLALLIFH